MTSSIAFSICIPCYNGRKYLRETLESVRAQTHANWELILVEDASPEPCKDIVEEFAARITQKVHYCENDRNLGCSLSREKGLKLASHDYLALLDADDIWKPNHLAELARVFDDSNPDFVFNSFLAFRDNVENVENVEFDSIPAPEWRDQLRLAYFYTRYWLQPSSIAFKRSIFDLTGPWAQGLELKPDDFPGNRNTCEDHNFFIRAFFLGIEPVWTGSLTVFYRQHDDSMRGHQSFTAAHRAWDQNLQGPFPGLPRSPQRKHLGYANANAGRLLRKYPEHRRWAARFYFKAWLWYPLRFDRLLLSSRALIG